MRVLVALGGNAMLKRGEPMTAEAQRANGIDALRHGWEHVPRQPAPEA